MAQDYNIYIKNGMGGKSGARQKLSAKGSIQRANNNKIGMSLKKSTSMITGGINSMSSGSGSSVLVGGAKKAGIAGAIAAAIISVADKAITFGINLQEANTGEQIRAHNSKATLKTITSFGTNYLYGGFQNELFTKKVISRQNFGLDYGREIYQINMNGTKNKRI